MWVGECVCLECKGSVCVCVHMTFENTAVHRVLVQWGSVCVHMCVFCLLFLLLLALCAVVFPCMCVGKWIFAAVSFLCAAYPEICAIHIHVCARTHTEAPPA